MLKPFFPSNNNHHGVICRGDNAPLLLASKARVNVISTIVNAANLKPPTYYYFPSCISLQPSDFPGAEVLSDPYKQSGSIALT